MNSKRIDLFLIGLGLIYFSAFYSLYIQIDGLIGLNGILPAQPYIESIKNQLGFKAFFLFPSLSLLNSSDKFTSFMCISGLIFSIITIVFPRNKISLIFMWLLYLSLSLNSQIYLGFQWDILLLEVGFLAIFIKKSENSVIIWLYRLLLFKIMFSSGIVKLSSGDPHWKDFTALEFHFFTQPLPLPMAWVFHDFGSQVLKFACLIMFIIEILVPFLIFINNFTRKIALNSFIFFMILIFLTGNYTFFNILTALICIFLTIPTEKLKINYSSLFATLYILISSTQIIDACRFNFRWLAFIEGARSAVAPFRSINSYGLFQVMTTKRLEIDVQGTNTPEIENSWKSYVFKYKPGDLSKRPSWCQPHQPRLDWQMWFAALGNADQNPWYINFLIRLLEGKPEVIALLAENPFPGKPPKYIRGKIYEYKFASEEEHEKQGMWWSRNDLGLYSRPIFLRDK